MSTKLANLALHCYLLDQALASQQCVFERKRTFGWGVRMEDWTTSGGWAWDRRHRHAWAPRRGRVVPNARHK